MKWIWALAFLVVVAASNPEEEEIDADTLEGDMTPEQKAAALSGGDVDASLGRGATKGRQWSAGLLSYKIDDALGHGSCADKHRRCSYWISFCSYHPYVRGNCKKKCRLC